MTIKITAKLHFLFGTAKWNGILFTELYTGADENLVIIGRRFLFILQINSLIFLMSNHRAYYQKIFLKQPKIQDLHSRLAKKV